VVLVFAGLVPSTDDSIGIIDDSLCPLVFDRRTLRAAVLYTLSVTPRRARWTLTRSSKANPNKNFLKIVKPFSRRSELEEENIRR